MWVVWTVGCLVVMYLAIGVIAGYVNAKSIDDDFKFDLMKVLKWPKDVIGK